MPLTSGSFSLNSLSTPIRRTRSGCCAHATSGPAAALPSHGTPAAASVISPVGRGSLARSASRGTAPARASLRTQENFRASPQKSRNRIASFGGPTLRLGAAPKTDVSHAYRDQNCGFRRGHCTGGHNRNSSNLETGYLLDGTSRSGRRYPWIECVPSVPIDARGRIQLVSGTCEEEERRCTRASDGIDD
jgi:hypothetical protein